MSLAIPVKKDSTNVNQGIVAFIGDLEIDSIRRII